MTIGDPRLSNDRAAVSDQTSPGCGHIGTARMVGTLSVSWSGGWLIFAIALWWAIATLRRARRQRRGALREHRAKEGRRGHRYRLRRFRGAAASPQSHAAPHRRLQAMVGDPGRRGS